MTDFACGFRLHLRGGQVLDGAAFPSGRCLVIDDPQFGLGTAAASEEDLLRGYPDARIEWADDDRDQLAAAVDRVRDRCQGVRDRIGPSGMINASQILGLLSPTWPDGNFEAPAPTVEETP
ncbi:hypothetical protein AB0903_31075 [Streptomyces sp. NPDC048389]|uniref:hypothetical protein n=1 Tax=Streptomyces sp. NPDC048389 TaxID=3154622 RepID=UPI00345612E4